MERESKIIECIQCDAEFEFSVSSQLEYEAKGYDEPKRCPACRKRKSKASSADSEDRWRGKKKNYHSKDAYEN
jgi:hypothetical protein